MYVQINSVLVIIFMLARISNFLELLSVRRPCMLRLCSTTAPGLWYKMQKSFGYLTFGGDGFAASNGGFYHFPVAIGETGTFYTAVGLAPAACMKPAFVGQA